MILLKMEKVFYLKIFKGQNRVCIVVLIYLMKKYKWSLKKSMEYLKSKKQDVDIPSYFLSQLIKFESRLF